MSSRRAIARRTTAARRRGYSLIELIMVMLILGALAAVGGVFIVQPFRASADMTRRAALVDEADLALERIGREVRTALPNSVRVDTAGDLAAIEFVLTRTGGRYRRHRGTPGGTGNPLDRAQSNDVFDALGGLPDIAAVREGSAGIDCARGSRDCINVYNTGQIDFDVYEQDNVAAVVGWTDNAGTDQVEYDTGGTSPAFNAHSPRQRFYVIETVVSYVCDLGAGTLERYDDYGLTSAQPLPPSGSGAALADSVTDCSFEYESGTSSRRGLLKTRIELSEGGETIRLFTQTHVENAP